MKPFSPALKKSNLHLSAPIDRWDEAIPLGNGLMGALLWGDHKTLKFSLDRGDLWDVRVPEPLLKEDWNWETLKTLVAEKNHDKMMEIFDKPASTYPYPSKIPAGRLEVSLSKDNAPVGFHLDLSQALGRVEMKKGSVEAFCSAVEPVGMIRVQNFEPKVKIVPAAFGKENVSADTTGVGHGSLGRMGYPAPKHGKSGNITWTLQQAAEGFEYAIVVGVKTSGKMTEIAYAITTSHDGVNPLVVGIERVTHALDAGYVKIFREHGRWWKDFWSQSAVSLPDQAIEQHYYLNRYFYGSASRRGAPPIALQGVWTADEGALPPWKGDYHNDTNTQLTYWPYLSANHLDEGLCFLDFLWDRLETFREYARDFFKARGAAVPGVMAFDGQVMAGWPQYHFSPTAGAWIGQTFYLHWRYTMDKEFLAERAYPFCREVGEFIESLLEEDETGKLKLPLSVSPEIHEHTLDAWLKPNSTYDLSLMRWLFGALSEMASALKDRSAAKHWKSLLDQLEDYPTMKVGMWGLSDAEILLLARDKPLDESHRHHSHLMPIHPLGILNMEGSKRDQELVRNSLRWVDHRGMHLWVGFSFSWMSCLASRSFEPNRALTMLELFVKAFVSRNGFHLNGDFKNHGVAAAKYRPFTMESGFAAAQAVHEIVLQSWGGVVRIFPAVSEAWQDVAFDRLRSEGAFRVSAERKGGKTVAVRIVAETDNQLKLLDPFCGLKVKWNRKDIKRKGSYYLLDMKAGDSLEGKLV